MKNVAMAIAAFGAVLVLSAPASAASVPQFTAPSLPVAKTMARPKITLPALPRIAGLTRAQNVIQFRNR